MTRHSLERHLRQRGFIIDAAAGTAHNPRRRSGFPPAPAPGAPLGPPAGNVPAAPQGNPNRPGACPGPAAGAPAKAAGPREARGRGQGGAAVPPDPPPAGPEPARGIERPSPLRGDPKGEPRYRANRTVGPDMLGGERVFPSAHEANVARNIDNAVRAGLYRSCAVQVSFIVGVDRKPDGSTREVRHRPDFLLIHSVNDDGTFVGELVDAKGRDTDLGRMKRAALLRMYGLAIRLIEQG